MKTEWIGRGKWTFRFDYTDEAAQITAIHEDTDEVLSGGQSMGNSRPDNQAAFQILTMTELKKPRQDRIKFPHPWFGTIDSPGESK